MNKDEYTTTVETGYSDPKEHSDEIRELLDLIHKKHKKIFKMKHITKLANPENKLSFAARMRYATKYLLSTGIISIYHRGNGGAHITSYKCNVDFDMLEEIINAMDEYNLW
jgi:predicted transcriptional regulator